MFKRYRKMSGGGKKMKNTEYKTQYKSQGLIILTSVIVLYTLVFPVFANCIQEYANVSTICGGLNGGSYINKSTFNNMDYFYDGDWSTSTTTGMISANMTIIYKKPTHALNTSLWITKDGFYGILNNTIPKSCWDYNLTNITFIIEIGSMLAGRFYCLNASGLHKMVDSTIGAGSNIIFEESMSWDMIFQENSQSYNSSTYETNNEGFSINISYNDAYTASVILIYNGTNYLATETKANDYSIFTRNLDVPLVDFKQNKSFYWQIQLTNKTATYFYNSSWHNQSISPLVFTRCNATYLSPVFVNYTIYEENTSRNINASMDATFNFKLSGSTYKSYSLDSEANNTFQFCTNYNSTFTVEPVIKLTAAGYNERTYYLYENYSDTVTTERKLYLLGSSAGTNVIITLKDYDMTPLSDYFAEVYRYYPETNSYGIIESKKTDINGEFTAMLIENTVKYKFIFKNESGYPVLSTGDVYIACKATICQITFIVEDTTDFFEEFENITDYDWTFNFDNSTNIFTLTWNDVSGVSASMRLYAERFLMNGTTVVCNTTSSSASGSLTCDVGASYASYMAQAFRTVNGDENRLGVLNIRVGRPSRTFGTEGLLLSFFLLMTMISFGYWKPTIGIALYLVGFVALTIIPIIYVNPAILIAEFVIGIIFIWAFRG